MSFYQPQPHIQPQAIRRSYEPPAQASQASRAGVGLLFMTTQDNPPQIVVKEVVQSGSAWRSGMVKAGDIIIKVENVNIQNQPLSNLRDLILGEPGTFVTLGFNRGSQYIEARMMRGTPDFLDKHMSAPNPSGNLQRSMPQTTTAASSSITSPGGLAREFEELERLRTALSRSQAEVTQLRTNLRSQEIQNERNSEELRTYREALSKREEENSSSRTAEDRNREIALQNFKQRFDQERQRLGQALEKSQAASRALAQVMPNILAMQQQYR